MDEQPPTSADAAEVAWAFFERLEEQLADKEIPPPPAEPVEAS